MIYTFEDFELDTDQLELRHNGAVRKMEPLSFSLLVYLVEHHERALSKDDINAHVWGGRIVSEAALSSCIYAVRVAVDDSGQEQRLVKTIHGKGFRFIGELEPLGNVGAVEKTVKTQTDFSELADKQTIAVLPFDNMSSDPEQEYLADGLCEDIITILSKIPGLKVIARNSSFAYKGKSIDVREAGRALGVRYILEGSVRCAGSRMRVTGQLIDTADGSHLWAERFDRRVDDIFALQDEMTREIVSALQVTLTAGDAAQYWAKGTDNFEAWRHQVQAPALINTQRKSDVLKGRRLAQKAAALDSDYAEPWAAIGISHYIEALGGWGEEPTTALQKSIAALQEALHRNDQNPTALVGMGLATMTMGNYEEGYRLARTAYALAPNSSEVAGLFALTGLFCEKYDELETLFAEAFDYFPIYPAWLPTVSSVYHCAKGKWDEAYKNVMEAAHIDNDFLLAHAMHAIICINLQKEAEAKKSHLGNPAD